MRCRSGGKAERLLPNEIELLARRPKSRLRDAVPTDLDDNGAVELRDRITVDPKVLVGKPVIAGTRISVEFAVDLLGSGWTHERILASYPHLPEQDILACLQYAAELLHSERVYPVATA